MKKMLAVAAVSALLPLCANDGVRFVVYNYLQTYP